MFLIITENNFIDKVKVNLKQMAKDRIIPFNIFIEDFFPYKELK